MLIIQKGQVNELVMNINNNSRTDFTGYTLTFIHVMSEEVKSYTVNTSNPSQYADNIRYCEIVLDLYTNDLNYEGQYELNIYGNGTSKVFTGMAELVGNSEPAPFVEYISPNEDNENYIYLS
jgi:hypothetical protein